MTRTKIIPIDNVEHTIGELTFDQVEAYLSTLSDKEDTTGLTLEEIKARRAIALRDVTIVMICNSLNNAILGCDEGGEQIILAPNDAIARKLWDPRKFKSTFGYITFQTLNREILLFSGLSLEQKSPGELAAEELISGKSAAASLQE